MLKRDALKIFDTDKLDDYAHAVQFRGIKANEIPPYYRTATRMVLKYGCNWWKHIYLDSVGKCIIAEDRNKRKNIGIIKSIDLNSGTVYIYDKNNPNGYQDYKISYDDFVTWVERGLYTLRLVSNYEQ